MHYLHYCKINVIGTFYAAIINQVTMCFDVPRVIQNAVRFETGLFLPSHVNSLFAYLDILKASLSMMGFSIWTVLLDISFYRLSEEVLGTETGRFFFPRPSVLCVYRLTSTSASTNQGLTLKKNYLTNKCTHT